VLLHNDQNWDFFVNSVQEMIIRRWVQISRFVTT
jgi:hypothetical protein